MQIKHCGNTLPFIVLQYGKADVFCTISIKVLIGQKGTA